MLRVLPLLLLVIEVVSSPCLHVLHLESEWQGQNPEEVGLFYFQEAIISLRKKQQDSHT